MRASKMSFFVPLLVLTGCPQVLDDYSVGSEDHVGQAPEGGGMDDASSGGSSEYGASGGASFASGGLSGSSGSGGASGSSGGALSMGGVSEEAGSGAWGNPTADGGGTKTDGSAGPAACVPSQCPQCGSVSSCCTVDGLCGCNFTWCVASASSGSSSDACALVTHDNGAGQTWQDCASLGTYDSTQAMKACAAWCALNGGCACSTGTSSPCNDPLERVHAYSGSFFIGWSWQGSYAGHVTKVTTDGINSECTIIGAWN